MIREVLGQGTLFDGADLLLGSWASILRVEIMQLDNQFLLALLPPGAFITMGFLIAGKNIIDQRLEEKQPKVEQANIERVRVNFEG